MSAKLILIQAANSGAEQSAKLHKQNHSSVQDKLI